MSIIVLKYKKRNSFWAGWNDEVIDQVDENLRLDSMFQRAKVIFDLDFKEHVCKYYFIYFTLISIN